MNIDNEIISMFSHREPTVNSVVTLKELQDLAYQFDSVKCVCIHPGSPAYRGICERYVDGTLIILAETITPEGARCFPDGSGIELDEVSIVWATLLHELGHSELKHIKPIQPGTVVEPNTETMEQILESYPPERRRGWENLLDSYEIAARRWALAEYRRRFIHGQSKAKADDT